MTLSLTVLLAIAVAVMVKTKYVSLSALIVCTVFGVFLAATAIGVVVRSGATSLAEAIASVAGAL